MKHHALQQQADTILAQAGQKWTVPRRVTYAALLEQDAPVSAYQLMDFITRHGDGALKPPSVYRALGFLQEMGLAVKIESLNAFLACKSLNHTHRHVMLLCDSCGQTNELCDDMVEAHFVKRAAEKGFKVSRPVMELHGSCQNCQH